MENESVELRLPFISGDSKYWLVYDWVKRELFGYLRKRISEIDWLKDWLEPMKEIHKDLISKWEAITEFYSNDPEIDPRRLRGVFYELLFYFACLKTGIIFKGAWIMEVGGDSVSPGEEPPWLEIVPIYEILPTVFVVQEEGKRQIKAPKIGADFLISFWGKKEGTYPLIFVDVKSSKTLVRKDNKKREWASLGAYWFNKSVLYIAYPEKDSEYPDDFKDWTVEQVCPEMFES